MTAKAQTSISHMGNGGESVCRTDVSRVLSREMYFPPSSHHAPGLAECFGM